MTLKTGTMGGLIVFSLTLAYYVSSRLSTETLDIAVGVLCGIAASLPVSIGLLVALTRERREESKDELDADFYPAPSYGTPPRQMPHVIVIAPPQGQYTTGSIPVSYPGDRSTYYPLRELDDALQARDWRIIGNDE
jgi:hypothetical protein